MSIVERDERATQLADTSRDLLESPQLRAVVEPFDERWLALDDPDSANDEEWLESDTWYSAGEMR